MARLTIQQHVILTVSHHLGDSFVEVKLTPVLVEVACFEIDAMLDLAALRLALAKEQMQERALANAVVAYKANTITPHNPD